ncbi:MAG: MarR family transcriptional regulator [Thermoleophilia bacterium]|nr:MarR family transcriptional regulator [Thermoleophilia bacterium]
MVEQSSIPVAAAAEDLALEAWGRLLRGHAATVRALNTELLRRHGLTINDYEVLLLLAHSAGRRLRRADLVANLHLTPSGITRLLEGLERCGYVARANCADDARVVYAVLTDAGEAKLRAASDSHAAAVGALLGSRYSAEELERLSELLSHLPGADADVSCRAP